VLGQWGPHSFENQLNCCDVREVDDDDNDSINNNRNRKGFKIQRLCNGNTVCVEYKTKFIPVIIAATGTISNSLRKYLNNIPGRNDIKEL
jgi:hypothetical protein